MIIYVPLILIPLLIVNYLTISNMRTTILRDIEVNQLKAANILSNIARVNIKDIAQLKVSIKQYPTPMEGRVIVLNKNKNVIADSFNHLEGRTVDNSDIRAALRRMEKQDYYYVEKNILQTAVPIFEVRGDDRIVIGAVLISSSVDKAFGQIEDFRNQLTLLSLGVALIGMVSVLMASRSMAKPIEELSRAANVIGRGNFGLEVKAKSKDEIGKLAEDFNKMSKELYRIDQGRTQFIGDVSHELKTPLASMKALIDSLVYGESDVEIYKEYLRDMDGEIDRLANLVKSLLSLTKIEEIGITKELIPVNKPINSAYKILKPLIEKFDIQLSIHINNGILLECDEQRVTEVFINLIDNAIKYRDNTEDICKIHVYDKVTKDEYMVIIEDNGVGIDKVDLELIFEKFYRGDFSRSRETGGAGIGLSIVSRIIAVHGWEIRAESELGLGTTVTISIPKKSFKVSL